MTSRVLGNEFWNGRYCAHVVEQLQKFGRSGIGYGVISADNNVGAQGQEQVVKQIGSRSRDIIERFVIQDEPSHGSANANARQERGWDFFASLGVSLARLDFIPRIERGHGRP
jgi:hypothetical protein